MVGKFRCFVAVACVPVLANIALAGPRNVIICIGDGMGTGHVEAARCYNGAPLSFESLPYQGTVTTYSADNPVTESASSATSLATGYKVNNDVISMAYPGDGSELETVLEYYRDRGRSTGLVTTTHVTEFTPGAFGAHVPDRNDYWAIASDLLNQTKPNVMFGGRGTLSEQSASLAGYTVITDADEMFALDTDNETYVSGQFGSWYMPFEYWGLGSLPHLSEMTQVALDILDNDPDGFFLMMEGGRIDHAGHYNWIEHDVLETLEFANSVQVILDWAAGRTDTLVIVTADHETGGLAVEQDNGPGELPTVSWSTHDHAAADVPIYTWGVNADTVSGVMDNTEIYDLMIMSEPADFNGDENVDAADIDLLGDFIRNGTPYDALYDISADGVTGGADGVVDVLDMDYLVRFLVETAMGCGTEYGDFSLDGLVDATDLTRLATNFGTGHTWAEGNANGYLDLVIDTTDLTLLAAYYGFGAPDMVPEPATLGLLALGTSGLMKRRKKRPADNRRPRHG